MRARGSRSFVFLAPNRGGWRAEKTRDLGSFAGPCEVRIRETRNCALRATHLALMRLAPSARHAVVVPLRVARWPDAAGLFYPHRVWLRRPLEHRGCDSRPQVPDRAPL